MGKRTEYNRNYATINKDKINARRRLRRKENPEKYRKLHNDYIELHREKINARKRELCKKYYYANKPKFKEMQRIYSETHREEIRERAKKNRKKVRFEVLSYYGGTPPKCKCCGETILSFLSIDHINGGGRQHRKKIGDLTYWLKRSKFPEGFQVLCHNCNQGRAFNNGICPHEIEKLNIDKLMGVEYAT